MNTEETLPSLKYTWCYWQTSNQYVRIAPKQWIKLQDLQNNWHQTKCVLNPKAMQFFRKKQKNYLFFTASSSLLSLTSTHSATSRILSLLLPVSESAASTPQRSHQHSMTTFTGALQSPFSAMQFLRACCQDVVCPVAEYIQSHLNWPLTARPMSGAWAHWRGARRSSCHRLSVLGESPGIHCTSHSQLICIST